MKQLLYALGFAVLLGVAGTPAMAQATTGQLSGRVVDDAGHRLPGVTITATSKRLQGERSAISGNDGSFNIPVLPTGSYTLKAELAGYQRLEMEQVQVGLGTIIPVEMTLRKGELVETVVVTAEYPLIQPKTADTAMILGGEQLDSIPSRARTFVDLTRLVPSITATEFNNSEPAGREPPAPSIRGEGQYGDNYLVDGLSVRDPSVKTSGTPLNFDAIEQVQIITDGFSPEYGQALGGSVNVITKSGSNTFGGEVAYLSSQDGLASDSDETLLATPASFERNSPYLNLGGPVVQDELWYFFSYNRFDNTDTFAPSQLPGFGTLEGGEIDTSSDLYFGKLTWAITLDHKLSGNYTYRKEEIDGLDAGIATREARRGQDVQDRRLRLNYQAILSPHSVIELKLGSVNRKIDTAPQQGLGPAQYELSDFGLLTNNAWRVSDDERARKDAAIAYTHFWNPDGKGGAHEFKIGVDYRDVEQDTGSMFSGLDEDVFAIGVNPTASDFGQADSFDGGAKFSLISAGNIVVPAALQEYRSAGILNNRNKEYGFFVQDRWEIGNWNVLLGVRADKQKSFNDVGSTFFEYDFGDALAPRISITWDRAGKGVNLLKAGWGRFFDTTSVRLGEFANSRTAFAVRFYGWAGGTDEDFSLHIDDGSVYDIHEPSNWVFAGEQSEEQNPIDFGPLRQPIEVERLLLEYNRRVAHDYVLKARYVDGQMRKGIEDVHYDFLAFTMANTDLKRRDYESFEIEFNGTPTPHVSFNTAWVHSDSKGTNPGQFERAGNLGDVGSGVNIGVYLDRPPAQPEFWCDFGVAALGFDPATCTPLGPFFGGWPGASSPMSDFNNDDQVDQFDFDMFWQNLWGGLGAIDGEDGWYGKLPYAIDDLVKISGRFVIPRWKDLYISLFAQWASGYHDQRRGFQPLYGNFFTYSDNVVIFDYIGACTDFSDCETIETKTPVADQTFGAEDGERRGSRENGSFWTVDLSIGKVWDLRGRYGFEVRGDLFNLFDEQEALAFQNRATSSYGEPLVRQAPRTLRVFARLSF